MGKRKRKDIIGWSKVLTKQEQQQLMSYLQRHTNNLNGRRLYLICDVLLNTGLRASELCALRVKDTPYVLGRNVIEVYRGKGDKDRTVPISMRMSEQIKHYIKHLRLKNLPRHVKRSEITRCLFFNYHRRPYTRFALYWAVSTAARKAGIAKPISPHKLRHTFATNVLIKGVNVGRLQRLLGHSDLMTTSKYLDIVEEMDGQLGEQIDQAFDWQLWGG